MLLGFFSLECVDCGFAILRVIVGGLGPATLCVRVIVRSLFLLAVFAYFLT